MQRALSVLQLLGGVTMALFLAGVVVPSLFRSGMAANHTSAGGSLHALTIGGVTFGFTLQNLGSALLGGVFAVLIAFAIEFPAAFAKTARKFLVFLQGHLSAPAPSLGNPRRARFLSLETLCGIRESSDAASGPMCQPCGTIRVDPRAAGGLGSLATLERSALHPSGSRERSLAHVGSNPIRAAQDRACQST